MEVAKLKRGNPLVTRERLTRDVKLMSFEIYKNDVYQKNCQQFRSNGAI